MKGLFVTLGVIVTATAIGVFSWIAMSDTPEKPPQLADVAAIEQINNAISPAAGVPADNAAPAAQLMVAPPKSTQPNAVEPLAVQTAPDQAQKPTASEIISSTTPEVQEKAEPQAPVELTLAQMNEIHTQVKQSVENDFNKMLSFPLTEAKMIAFTQAGNRVKKINNKWDVQIAGAETDTMAIEYSNFAVEEITKSLQSISELTLEQYNEMSKLTASNEDFNRVYQVYKKLMEEGVIEAPPVPLNNSTTTTNPVVAPVNPGTAQVPQGSPAPQYSQPSSR